MYLFSLDYPPQPGGIARLCSELAAELWRQGSLQAVLTARPGWQGRPAGLREHLVSRRRGLQELQGLAFLSRDTARDVVCGRWWPEGALVTSASRHRAVVLAHGAELLRRSRPREQPLMWLRKRVLSQARLVVANSRFTRGLVSEIAPGARCTVIEPAVDVERFSPGDRAGARQELGLPATACVIATVARLQHNKGHVTVLRALAQLTPEERSRLVYVIAGRGPAIDGLRALASELGVSEQVRWLGFVPETQLPAVYRAADLHVLLSERSDTAVEGFGMVSLESQACGVPVLGASSGGIADSIVEGEGGLLLRENAADDAAAQFRSLLIEPERFRALGAAGRARVLRDCTWTKYVQRLLQALGERHAANGVAA